MTLLSMHVLPHPYPVYHDLKPSWTLLTLQAYNTHHTSFALAVSRLMELLLYHPGVCACPPNLIRVQALRDQTWHPLHHLEHAP